MARKKPLNSSALPASPSPAVTRRAALKYGLALGVLPAASEAQNPAPPDKPELTTADVAASDKIAGRNYSESERKQMLKTLKETRDDLTALRTAKTPPELAPAFHFEPRPANWTPPKGRSSLRLSEDETPDYDGNPESLAFASIVALSRLLKARRVTSLELTQMYLARLKRLNPKLLCVVNFTEELALRQAAQADKEIHAGKYRGALHGIPFGAKDLFAVKGYPTTWGAKPYESQHFSYDATVIERLEAAGAVLIAKLSMGELAMGDTWFGGMTRNPWDLKQGSSGSSAGSGSAVAAGCVGFALGTETLGSIVSPSVRNGVTGLRPTFGRVPRTGAMPLSWTMDKIGPMCRTVEDCALVFGAIQGADGKDATVRTLPFSWDAALPLSKIRVGMDTASFEQLAKEAKRKPIYDAALDKLKSLGITLIPVTLPKMTPAYGAIAGTVIGVEGAAAFTELNLSGGLAQLAQQREDSWPTVFRVGSTIPASDYVQAMRLRAQLQHEMAAALEKVDVVVAVPNEGDAILWTNLCGQPTIVTRCGMRDGKPESLEFYGRLDAEAQILRVAFAYEQATTWHTETPKL